MLVDSLTLSETPISLKVARLFLLSDILHNTTAAVRNASRYRSKLEEHLPDVFESLQVGHWPSLAGKLCASLQRAMWCLC